MVERLAPCPDNHYIAWDEDDIEDTVLGILAQINDNLANAKKQCYFAIIPSQQNGIEIAFVNLKDDKQ